MALALGPVTSLKHVGATFLKTVARYRIDYLFEKLKIVEILQNTDSTNRFQALLCSYLHIFCEGLLSILADANVDKDDSKERFLVFVAHYPAGTSLRSLQHFADSINKERFGPLGSNENYNLHNINGVPISLFVGKDDRLATVEDNRILKEILEKNGALKFYREYDDTGHCSFFISEHNSHIEDMVREIEDLNKHIK